jgi:glutamate N-acetyltransferase/amino-acid N-acetyltransferase
MNHPVPQGFRLAGVHCGVKSDPSKEDVTLITTDSDSVAAGVYTQNVVHAASVKQNRAKTPFDRFRVVVVNSGNANACTGERGAQDARELTRLAAESVGATEDQALGMSTGIIGEYLSMDRLAAGVTAVREKLGTNKAAFDSAVRGITTTDKFVKVASRSVEIDGQAVQVTAMAKGAGMIGPNMATMLCVAMTDAALDAPTAQRILSAAVDESFNSGIQVSNASAEQRLQDALTAVCVELARMIPTDGEGASHLITIDVKGCATREDARQIAKTVADSPLVKTGIAGADPNWGRIISAAGYAGVQFDASQLTLSINGTLVYENSMPFPFDDTKVSASIRDNHETHLELTLGEGDAAIRFWTSDLTVDYVRFNSEYTT